MTAPTVSLKAQDIMTPRVVTIRPDATVEQAVSIMLERRISGLPVVNGEGRLVGMITEGDLLRRAELGTEPRHGRWLRFLLSPGRLADEYAHARARKVADVMTADVVSATEDTPLAAIVDLMTRHKVKRVPIVHNGAPIGMLSRADLLRALARNLAQNAAPAGGRSDDEILADIKAEFERAGCVPIALVDVTVRDGIVELKGAITDERERAAIRVAIENVPGVAAIRDHLAWVDTMSGIVIQSPDDAVHSASGQSASATPAH